AMHKISKQGDIDLELDETLIGQQSQDLEAALHNIRHGKAQPKTSRKIAPEAESSLDLDETIVGESPDITAALANIRRQRGRTKPEPKKRPKRAHKLDFVLTENQPPTPQRRTQKASVKSAGKTLSVGQTLAYQRYTIKAFLSQDRVSQLYLARDSRRGENIAIRVLNPNVSDGDKVSFFHSAQRASELQHENIVHIYDAQHEQNLTYVSMEVSQGKSLRKLIAQRQKQNSPFQENEVIEIINPLCDALSYVHQQGSHGDISPKNIWLDVHNNSKLSGFASINSSSSSKKALFYKAPEQRLNAATTTQQSDQYSLAAIAYEMATGSPPREIAVPLQNMRSDLNQHFCDAIDKALQPQGMRRFKEIETFKTALNNPAKTNTAANNGVQDKNLTPILIGIIALLTLIVAVMLIL
ncbi:MAG: protein kinase, partial [Gammaproteobacteria bacterium]|nr:protein kinase [Gammaproteobacteria bacterium]